MVTLTVGFPGSGKSYYAIDYIYNLLSDSNNDKKFDYIYTNINGVKFDYFPDSNIQFKKFIEEDFYNYLIECFTYYEINKSSDSVDDGLIEISQKRGYHNCLIVFDECHDFFSNQDKYKIFWLTYHRHLFHEIILLTQNKTLIHSKYRAIPEIFIEAQPRSKKVFGGSLKYKCFVSFAMRKTDLFETKSIKTRKEVFNLYQSGNFSNQKSVILKYIYFSLFFFALVIFGFYAVLSQYIVNDEPIKNEPPQVQKVESKSNINIEKTTTQKITFDNPDSLVIKLICDNQKGCKYEDNIYPIFHIDNFLLHTKSKTLFKSNIFRNTMTNKIIYNHFILTNRNFLNQYFILKPNNANITPLNNTNFDFKEITSGVTL